MDNLSAHAKTLKANQETTFSEPIEKYVYNLVCLFIPKLLLIFATVFTQIC